MNSSQIPDAVGFLRNDGRKGIRNIVLVVYLVECAHHVAREITGAFRNPDIHIIGFGGCYPNAYADKMMNALCVHPNVGAVLLVSLGCESFNRNRLLETVQTSGRPAKLIGIQHTGGTRSSIEEGIRFVEHAIQEIQSVPQVPLHTGDLCVGVVCGGSDATSGITANPSVGNAFDRLVEAGGTAIFENTGELIGLEEILASRAVTTALGLELKKAVEKASDYYSIMGHGSFAPGNAEGGLTTQEEKSMGAYCKTGTAPIKGMIKPADKVPDKGLYLMDIVPDGEPRFGFPNPNDSTEIAELIASGAHCIMFTTGRGSVVGSAIAPVIKVCANPETYLRMQDDMDVNAGKILLDQSTVADVGLEIFNTILRLSQGYKTCSERLGHQEFALGYKTFATAGPACLP